MVQAQHVSQVFRTRSGSVRALDDVSLHVNKGEFVVVRGPSGSGKTTLLLAVGGMFRPTSGQVLIDGCDLYAMSERARAKFRANNIGFVFQMFHLIPYLSVIENALLPAGAAGKTGSRTEARGLLTYLGLSEREGHKPSELSAGERQRAAVARALLNRPKLILADEPTGNLDPASAAEVIDGLAGFHRRGGTVIIVTHGTAADEHADRIVYLREGRVEDSLARESSAREVSE